jgi:hypothetical protein
MLASQVLFCLSHASSPFCSSYFLGRVLLFCQGRPGLLFNIKLPAIAGMSGKPRHVQLFSFDTESSRLPSPPPDWPGTVSLLISASWVAWGDRQEPSCPAVSWTCNPLASAYLSGRITGMLHHAWQECSLSVSLSLFCCCSCFWHDVCLCCSG